MLSLRGGAQFRIPDFRGFSAGLGYTGPGFRIDYAVQFGGVESPPQVVSLTIPLTASRR